MRPIKYTLGVHAAGASGIVAPLQAITAGVAMALASASPLVLDAVRTVSMTFGVDMSAAIAEDGGAFVDETTESNEATADDMTLFPAVPVAAVDRYNFGSSAAFSELTVNVSTVGTGTYTVVWEYFNGTIWVAIPGVTDGTNAFKNAGVSTVSFSPPSDWAATTINAQGPFFYIRAEIQTGTVTAVPIGQQAFIGSAGTGNRYSIIGTGTKGNVVYDTISGGALGVSVESVQVFASIISVTPEFSTGGDVSVDTLSVIPSPWIPLDHVLNDAPVAVSLFAPVGAAGISVAVELTQDNLSYGTDKHHQHHGSVFDIVHPALESLVPVTAITLAAAGNTAENLLPAPATAVRFVNTGPLTAGEIVMRVVQGHGRRF